MNGLPDSYNVSLIVVSLNSSASVLVKFSRFGYGDLGSNMANDKLTCPCMLPGIFFYF